MYVKVIPVLVLLVLGCICRSPPPEQPVIHFYVSTTSTTSTVTTITTTTTSTTTTILALPSTSTTSTVTTSTTSTTTSTLSDYLPGDYRYRKIQPFLAIPEGYNRCRNHSDCYLVTDCCGDLGRQYSINRDYRIRWYDRLKCWNHTKACYTNLNLKLNRYRYSICENQTCQKTYNQPE